MSPPTFSQMSRQEITSLQEDALRRVREMQKRAQRATQEANRLQLGPQDFPYTPPPTLGSALSERHSRTIFAAPPREAGDGRGTFGAGQGAAPAAGGSAQGAPAPAGAGNSSPAGGPGSPPREGAAGGGRAGASGASWGTGRPPYPGAAFFPGPGMQPRFRPGPPPGSRARSSLLGTLLPHWGGRREQPGHAQPPGSAPPQPADGAQPAQGASGALGSLLSFLGGGKDGAAGGLGEGVASALSAVSTPAQKVLDALGLDGERLIILMVLLVLLNEKADKTLLLALGYLLFSN